jgi:anti-sigma regulatory factor (Ser/Thr protein kinase)
MSAASACVDTAAAISNPAAKLLSIATPPNVSRPLLIAQLLAQTESRRSTTVRLRAGPEAVARAITAARAFAGEGEAADRLAIVAEEWVANVVEHGRPAQESLIVLRFGREGDALRLAVSDAGLAFDPTEAADDGPNLERGGGAGLALIRAWCELSYRRAGGRNQLELVLR